MKRQPWYKISSEDTLKAFHSDSTAGLKSAEAKRRLKEHGPNILQDKKKISAAAVFIDQFRDFMVGVLLAATLISGLLGEYSDALTIIFIIFINAMLGFVQEYRAERSLEALREMTAPKATVVRDGSSHEISAAEIVPGDVILLAAGERVAADMRLCEAICLTVDEAPLTGESVPVRKQTDMLNDSRASLGDQDNMIFKGTLVSGGKGKGVVVATGMETEMGKVASMMQESSEEDTPLQKRLEQVGKYLVLGCLVVCGLVVLLGIARGLPAYKMLMAGVSLAVAAIPEGLPAVVTVSLAIGVQRMARKKAIVRRLPAVETLGCTTVICADKTGTLTQNKMNVREIWAGGKVFRLEGEGYSPQGIYYRHGKKVSVSGEQTLRTALQVAALCTNTQIKRGQISIKPQWRVSSSKRSGWSVEGDATEGALVAAAARAGIWREELEKTRLRVCEIPFDGKRKRMSVIYKNDNGEYMACVKGAPEIILSFCSHILFDGKVRKLDREMKEEILLSMDTMTGLALRGLGVAYKQVRQRAGEWDEEAAEKDLIFAGMFGIMDPPRPEVIPAIKKCREAGIRTVMITGDHKNTAVAVARMIGVLTPGGKILTGEMLDKMGEAQLMKEVEDTCVYARVAPAHKLRIVKMLKKCGHVVAMTGDGINDAPAVKEADIGIAMGETGTEVTREAAAMVLADDNFTTIVDAVEEGRGIYENIRKFIRFLLSCNTGEILTMFLAMVVGLPLPLLAIQILWVNLITDGLPAIALGVDPVDPHVMKKPPRSPRENIFAGGLWKNILGRGMLIGVVTLAVFSWSLDQGMEIEAARTMAFATLIVSQLIHVFECSGGEEGIHLGKVRGNPFLLLAVGVSFLLFVLVLYNPYLANIFKTVPLEGKHWLVIFAGSLLPLSFYLAKKLIFSMVFPRVAMIKR